ITITSSSGLSKEEVEKMGRDADSHKAEDEHKREEVEVRNHLDTAIYSAEKTLKDHRDKVSPDDAKAVETAVEEARKAMGEGNVDRMKSAQEQLMQASHKLAEAMYKSASAQQAPSQDGSGQQADGGAQEPKKDDVVDAEFVDVDENKKK
ncbi:MAG TPA: Hsp70 family protein, partial [Bryobacteraceae bacterium]|nr:Hsp70 family protein [Bryobacteraceae bacterium]